MALNKGFEYVAGKDAAVLILGSMPGAESLRMRQYYAHPRNLFWSLMGEMFGFEPSLPYPERLLQLQHQHIALWDVAQQCKRRGSLDSNIKGDSVIANDFQQLFEASPQIAAIFFNGKKAEQLYRRLVLPGLPEPHRSIALHTLPSTSPAHAAMSREEKLNQWLQIASATDTVQP